MKKPDRRGRKRINPLHPAVRRAMRDNGGTLKTLADKLGITPQALAMWGKHIPLHHVKAIARMSGMDRKKLRPDIFS